MRALGLDLGGTNLKACVLDAGRPRVLAESRAKTRAEDGPGAVLDRLAGLARQLVADAGPVEAVGLGAPGPLDLETGRAVSMPNLPGWEDYPIAAELGRRLGLGLPVALLNDARATTLAEHRLGAGRGVADLACFVLGTGVGGGVVVGGRLLLGLNGTAGELGHQTVEPDGLPCSCGSAGCLEQYASGAAIARAAGAATAVEAFAAARAGDAAAAAAVAGAARYLGIGIANVVLALGPEAVVVGGGVGAEGDALLEPARRELERRDRMQPLERVAVVQAALGSRAGAIGAALWAAGRAAPPRGR